MSALVRACRDGACLTVAVRAGVAAMTGFLLTVLQGLAGPSPAAAQVTFEHVVIDATGPSRVWGKGAGDLNGDGAVDLVQGSYDGGLFWYRNPGWQKATISSAARIEEDMEVVDLDKDGRNDVVAVTTGGVTWFKNNGTSWSAQVLVSGLDLHDLEVKDLDRDGKLDLIGRNQSDTGNKLYLWRQSSLASWTRSVITLPEGGEGLLAVDLNRDDKVDIVIGKYWFKNNSSVGALSFTRYTYNAGAEKNAFVAAGRINADNYLDLVVSPSEPKGGKGDIAWYQAPATTANGWTKRTIQAGVESVHHFIGVADFDGDGDNDVATAMTHVGTNPKVKIFYNTDGAGTFGPASIIANTSSHSMKIVDIAGDGLKSLYGADYGNRGPTEIDLWRASAASPAPTAAADSASTNANAAVKIAVLANDSGSGLSVSAVTVPANGTAAINADQTVTYTPDSGFTGSDGFQYTIKDSANRTASATVSVTVRNRVPVAGDDIAETEAGEAVTIAVLGNDSDPDGHTLSVSAVSNPPSGAATINGTKTAVVYTPDAGFSGTDSFTYTVSDGHGGTDQGTVTVTVTATVPEEPVYLGCYADVNGGDLSNPDHDLNGFAMSSAQMTVALCTATCGSKGFSFAGARNGQWCFCGNSYGRYGTSSNCTTSCAGDRTQKCGGYGANSVYRLP